MSTTKNPVKTYLDVFDKKKKKHLCLHEFNMHLNMSFSCIRFDKVKLKVNINAINYQYNCAHVLDVAHIHVPLV